METAIAKLSIARRALIQAKSLNEVLDVCDMAAAIRAFAKAAGESLEVQNAASDLRLSAERKAGGLLASMQMSGGARDGKRADTASARLSDIGITHKQSSRWQLAAKLPNKDYAAIVANCNEAGSELTQAAVLKAARVFVYGEAEKPTEPPSPPTARENLFDLVAMARSAVADLIEAFGDEHIDTLIGVLRDEIATMEANKHAHS